MTKSSYLPDTVLCLNHWYIDMASGELTRNDQPKRHKNINERIDPLGIKLLHVLVKRKGELVGKDTLLNTLWPDSVVNEDALSRCVSRLRKQLGDDSRQPQFIETLPKRGYRLVAQEVSWGEAAQYHQRQDAIKWGIVGLLCVSIVAFIIFEQPNIHHGQSLDVSELVKQADSYYHNINRQDNEMALELYQQALALDPDDANAISGLANTRVQRAIRMPFLEFDIPWENMSLGQALTDGRLSSDRALLELEKAVDLANQSIDLAPNNVRGYKAKGFALSALNQFDAALKNYQQALLVDPNAWDVLINMGDIYELLGQLSSSIRYYKLALHAMNIDSLDKENLGKPWRASLGATIGNKYIQQNSFNEAEIWFRHVLAFAPFDAKATLGLSEVLQQTGRENEANRLCQAFVERIGKEVCTNI